jgi:hypothetical protein
MCSSVSAWDIFLSDKKDDKLIQHNTKMYYMCGFEYININFEYTVIK